jgi:ankyrin repeat protein
MGIVTVPLEDLVDGVLVNKWFTVHKSKTKDKEWGMTSWMDIICRILLNIRFWYHNVGQLHISLLSAFQYDLGHNTPLYKALSTGKMGPAARLLEQIDDRFDIELKDKDGDIGLHIFIRNCTDPTSVTSILDSFWRIGADFNATTKSGDTPLHLCIQNSAVRGVLVDWLLLHKKVRPTLSLFPFSWLTIFRSLKSGPKVSISLPSPQTITQLPSCVSLQRHGLSSLQSFSKVVTSQQRRSDWP